jgi:hypothetical protein
VYIDFFGEKLPSIPGEVIPLMLMSSMGYVANQHPQNPDVVWLLRLVHPSVRDALYMQCGSYREGCPGSASQSYPHSRPQSESLSCFTYTRQPRRTTWVSW